MFEHSTKTRRECPIISNLLHMGIKLTDGWSNGLHTCVFSMVHPFPKSSIQETTGLLYFSAEIGCGALIVYLICKTKGIVGPTISLPPKVICANSSATILSGTRRKISQLICMRFFTDGSSTRTKCSIAFRVRMM